MNFTLRKKSNFLLTFRLTISVDPISIFANKLFLIQFEKVEEIVLLKKAYKSYETIIRDLDFDGQNLLIKNDRKELTYVNIFLF